MKQNMEKRKPKRHLSFGGFFVFSVAAVLSIWVMDGAYRALRKMPLHYPEGEGIISEGIFPTGDSETDTVTLDNDPVDAAKEAGKTANKTIKEFEVKEAAATIPTTPLPANCVSMPIETKEISNGKLLLLDSTHDFSGSNKGLVDFSEKNDSYLMRVNDLTVKSEVVTALNKMAAAYVMTMERTDLMVYSTLAPVSDVCLYPEEMPDSATGYCVDLCVYTADGDIIGIIENSPWLTNNAHLYGFVRSYTMADEEVTGISSAPQHLRYVGKVHSMIMHEEGLTLTAYIDMLSTHPVTDPLYWTDGSTTWSVYYVPATAGTTQVPVPLNGNYEVSGNNVDGFIVTAEGRIGE